MVPSLNGVDPSFLNSVAGSYLQNQVVQISYTIELWKSNISIILSCKDISHLTFWQTLGALAPPALSRQRPLAKWERT